MVILVPGSEIMMLLLTEQWIATVTQLRVIMILITGAADRKVERTVTQLRVIMMLITSAADGGVADDSDDVGDRY